MSPQPELAVIRRKPAEDPRNPTGERHDLNGCGFASVLSPQSFPTLCAPLPFALCSLHPSISLTPLDHFPGVGPCLGGDLDTTQHARDLLYPRLAQQ